MKKIFSLLILFSLLLFTGFSTEYYNYTFENGTIPDDFNTNYNHPFKINNNGYNSNYDIISENINDNQVSKISLDNIEIAAGNITFYYKVSSEANYDFFKFYINNNEVLIDSGQKDWQQFNYQITAGVYNLSWRYIKDGSVSQGNDNVEVDNIVIPKISNKSVFKDDNGLILNYTPTNNVTATKTDFNIILSQKADCELYIDDKLVYSFNNKLSDTVSIDTPEDYTYYWYCEAYKNDSKVYSKTPRTDIKIILPVNQITFKIDGLDFDVNNESLYIATPCPVEGYSAIGIKVGYQPKYNPNGIYWEQVKNGYAIFNLTSGLHNFCIFNGRVIINEKGKTTDYNVVEKKGILNLGNFSIPNKNNQLYQLKVERWEIYDKTDPHAYNTTWSKLAGSMILFLLGAGVIYMGVELKNGKITIAGVILVLAAFGMSLNGIIALI